MERINRAWLEGRIDDLRPLVHAEMVMALPGFTGQVRGREDFLAGFREFLENGRIHDFREHDQTIDTIDDTAVITYRYDLLYEQSGDRYQATGRDFWIFRWHGGEWVAVWRTMFDLHEEPV